MGNFTGTGDKLCVYLYTEPIQQNDDNEYYLPDGTYTVAATKDDTAYEFQPGDITAGRWGNMELRLSRAVPGISVSKSPP